MIEVLVNFEQAGYFFASSILVFGGIGLLFVGLLVWLGGLFIKRLVTASLMALLLFGAAWLIGGNLTVSAATALAGAIFALIFVNVSTGMLAGLICGAVVYVGIGDFARKTEAQIYPQEHLDVQQSFQVMSDFARLTVGQAVKAGRDLSGQQWAMIAGISLAVMAIVTIFTRLGGSLFFSVLGSGLLFAGMLLLLIYKGSAPITMMLEQKSYYGSTFIVMAVFGMLVQIVLGPGKTVKKSAKAEKNNKEGEQK